jgi:hypothetical protein
MNYRKTAFAVLALSLFLPLYAGASDYSVLLYEAAAALNDDYYRDWAFTETSVEADVTTVARYDPGRPAGDRWEMLSVNGRAPTDEELAAFVDEKAEEESGDHREDDDSDKDVVETVQPESLSLIEETGDYWLFSFVPEEDEDDEGFLEFIDATLKIVKDGPYIESIILRSEKPFRPQFGVKVKDFLTRLEFGPAASGGPIVPMSIDIKINIRAYLVIGIDETSSTTFSDYQYVGD